MKPVKISVYCNEKSGSLVSNLEALDSRPMVRRFVGWQFNSTHNNGSGGWDPKSEAEEINVSKLDNLQFYIKSLKCGDLFAADEETADLANVSCLRK